MSEGWIKDCEGHRSKNSNTARASLPFGLCSIQEQQQQSRMVPSGECRSVREAPLVRV